MMVFKGQGECLYFSLVALPKWVFSLISSNNEVWWALGEKVPAQHGLCMNVCGWCVFCDGQVAAGMEPDSSDGNSFLAYDDIWQPASANIPCLPCWSLLRSPNTKAWWSTLCDEHCESCIYLNIDHHVFCHPWNFISTAHQLICGRWNCLYDI